MPSLLDQLLPRADAAEFHETRVRAPADVVMRALWRADLAGPVARALLALRALPAAVAGSRTARARLRRRGALTLDGVLAGGFALLGAHDDEVVLGITGRFWQLAGGLLPTDPATWAAGPPEGAAQGAWSFAVVALGPAETRLTTETRVRCGGAAARRAFARYWLVVRPFSGLIRRVMLRAVKREAERGAVAGTGAGGAW